MRTCLTVIAIVVLLVAVGCTGEQLAPGARASIQLDGKGGLYIVTTRDLTIGKATVTVPGSGTVLTLENYTGNGSTLGATQGASSVAMEQFYARNFDTLMREVLGPIIARYAGGGGIAVPLGGGETVTPAIDTPAQMELRNALLAKVANCPFMSADQKASLTASVKAAPAAYLSYLAPIVDQATTNPRVTP